jgi:oligosaccharide repeat unit polymerase
MFIISTFFAMMNVNTWGFTIAPITVVVILTSLMALGCGEFLVHLIWYKHKQRVPYIPPRTPIKIPFWAILLLCGILGILLLHYYNETVRIAVHYGYTDGPLMLAYARQAIKDPEVNRDRIALLGALLAKAAAYVFSFTFLYNFFFFKRTKSIKNLLPVLIYVPFIVLSAGRTDFIYLITAWFVVGCVFFMQKNGWRPRSLFKILMVGFSSIILFLFLFVFSGSFRSSSLRENALSVISYYAGLSIPSLDDFILHPRPSDFYFGENTLFGIYGVLRKLGFNYPFFYAPYDAVSFNGTRGNVYTIIRRYLEDFGFFGLYAILFFLGFLYSFFFFKSRNHRNFKLLLYAALFFPIVEAPIEERFFMSVVASGTVYSFILIFFFYYLFVNKSCLHEATGYLIGRQLKKLKI